MPIFDREHRLMLGLSSIIIDEERVYPIGHPIEQLQSYFSGEMSSVHNEYFSYTSDQLCTLYLLRIEYLNLFYRDWRTEYVLNAAAVLPSETLIYNTISPGLLLHNLYNIIRHYDTMERDYSDYCNDIFRNIIDSNPRNDLYITNYLINIPNILRGETEFYLQGIWEAWEEEPTQSLNSFSPGQWAPVNSGTTQFTQEDLRETGIGLNSSQTINYETQPASNRDPGMDEEFRLFERPPSHGVTNFAHNLVVKYKDCYGLLNGTLFMARDFRGNTENDTTATIYYELEGNNKSELFNIEKHKFLNPELGWVLNSGVCHYLELKVGGYLRAISPLNIRISITIKDYKIHTTESWRFGANLVTSLLNRRFSTVKEGLRSKLPTILSPDLLLVLLQSNNEAEIKEKYFLMYANMCIGEHVADKEMIRLYTPYKTLQPFLETVLNYEIK